MSGKPKILLPPSSRPTSPLPTWVGLVALLGLGILGISAIPAVWRRAALTRDLRHLRCETGAQEQRLLELRRALRHAADGRFARERALRRLLLAPR